MKWHRDYVQIVWSMNIWSSVHFSKEVFNLCSLFVHNYLKIQTCAESFNRWIRLGPCSWELTVKSETHPTDKMLCGTLLSSQQFCDLWPGKVEGMAALLRVRTLMLRTMTFHGQIACYWPEIWSNSTAVYFASPSWFHVMTGDDSEKPYVPNALRLANDLAQGIMHPLCAGHRPGSWGGRSVWATLSTELAFSREAEKQTRWWGLP